MFPHTTPMRSRRTRPLVAMSLLVPGLPGITWLAILALRQALEAGRAEFWMMALSLPFVVGAPVLALMLPVIEKLQTSPRSGRTIPRAGGKNP